MQPNGAMLGGMDHRQIGGGLLAATGIIFPTITQMMGLQLNPLVGWPLLVLCGACVVAGLVLVFLPHKANTTPTTIRADEQSTLMARSMVALAREIFVTVGKARLRRSKDNYPGKDEEEQRTQNEFLCFFGSRVEHARVFLTERGIKVSAIPDNWSATLEGAETAATVIGGAGRQLLLNAGIATD